MVSPLPYHGGMSTQLAPGSQSAVEEKTQPSFEDGDAERFSHYVPKAKLTDAIVNGTPVVALCGKVWVCLLYTSPSPRDQRGSRMPSSA